MRKHADGTVRADSMAKSGWIAICLEHYILADGDTIPEVKQAFEVALGSEILMALDDGKVPLEGLPPAPAKYHEMWKSSVLLADPIFVRPPEDEKTPLPLPDAAKITAAFRSLPRSAEVRVSG